MNNGPDQERAPLRPLIYFDGMPSRRRTVVLVFADQLEINEDDHKIAAWSYADIRRADSPAGQLRLTCLTAPPLARVEIRDAAIMAEITSRCTRLDENIPGRGGVARIIGWSLAGAVPVVLVGVFGVPVGAVPL